MMVSWLNAMKFSSQDQVCNHWALLHMHELAVSILLRIRLGSALTATPRSRATAAVAERNSVLVIIVSVQLPNLV